MAYPRKLNITYQIHGDRSASGDRQCNSKFHMMSACEFLGPMVESSQVRRLHSTYQKAVQGKCPLHFLHFNGAVCSNTLFSNTSALTNSLLFRTSSTCKGSRTPRLVEHFWVPIWRASCSNRLCVGTSRPSHQAWLCQAWLLAIFMQKRMFALSCACCLLVVALSCAFLRPTTFTTTMFGNLRHGQDLLNEF